MSFTLRSDAARKEEYETVKRELAVVIAEQQRLEKKKLMLRKKLEIVADLCELEGIEIERSPEAQEMLEQSLADEIRGVLAAFVPNWLSTGEIKAELEKLGRDLTKYKNAQSAIQMVLKRMVEAKDVEVVENSDRKQVFRKRRLLMGGVVPASYPQSRITVKS